MPVQKPLLMQGLFIGDTKNKPRYEIGACSFINTDTILIYFDHKNVILDLFNLLYTFHATYL